MTGPDETFPANLLSLMEMCIDDADIWKTQYEYIQRFDDYDEGNSKLLEKRKKSTRME